MRLIAILYHYLFYLPWYYMTEQDPRIENSLLREDLNKIRTICRKKNALPLDSLNEIRGIVGVQKKRPRRGKRKNKGNSNEQSKTNFPKSPK